MKISEIIIQWYKKNKRDLPWRSTSDPYRIWLSEIILQQTRVDQGMDYYLRFVETWPDLASLSAASEEEVLKMWQGLGYYSRARNLHKAAHQVMKEHNGIFPDDYKTLLGLKGIGPYTAAAIASFTSGEKVAVVDGNVARVLSRLFAVEEAVNSTAGAKKIQFLAQELLFLDDPATHNQAMMEFGALQCVPASPDCGDCPLRLHCEAVKQSRVSEFPQKQKKGKPVERFFTYLVMDQEERTWLRKRTDNDIWKQLYEFPMIETEKAPQSEELPELISEFIQLPPEEFAITEISDEVKHLLSHRTIRAVFVQLNIYNKVYAGRPEWISLLGEAVSDYPLPRLIERYVERG